MHKSKSEANGGAGFTPTDDPFDLFASWLGDATQSEINDPNAVAVASVDETGMPNVRMVLLKGVDDADAPERGFVFYTNFEGAKGRELLAHPKAALVFHWKSLERQVRVRGPVTTVTDAEADAYYASRPRLSRIELVGLLAHKDKYPRQLSGGMKQRLAIARALLFKPSLLLLDEPFGSLDYTLKDDLEDEIFNIYEKMNLTVVNVTHDIESALCLSNRILFIDEKNKSLGEITINHDDFRDKKRIKLSPLYSEIQNLIANEK